MHARSIAFKSYSALTLSVLASIIFCMSPSASAAVFLPRIAQRNILAGMPESPDDDVEGGEDQNAVYAARRLVLDLPEADLQTLHQTAEYRNAQAVGGTAKRLRGAWSRKSLAEHIQRRAAKELRKELAPVQEAYGPLPTIDLDKAGEEKERARFREAMAAYVRRMGRGKK